MKEYFSIPQMRDMLDDANTLNGGKHIGATTSINHLSCGDTRNRLYITPTEGKHLFYCHNCGSRGCLITDSRTNLRRFHLEKDIDHPGGKVEYKHRYWPMLSHCHGVVSCYLAAYLQLGTVRGIPQDAFQLSGGKCFIECGGALDDVRPTMNFCTGPSHSAIDEMPSSISEYEFAGVQQWRWSEGNVTKRSTGKMTPALFYNVAAGMGENLLVICEDPISAMCLVQQGADALCLFGTNIPSTLLCDYAIRYDRVMIWLDLDSYNNRTLSLEYARTCQLVNDNVTNFINKIDDTQLRYTRENKTCGMFKHDPKNYKPEYVRSTLESLIPPLDITP